MSQFVFVTGTDTGVGKTVFTAALTRWFRARGIGAVALKPLASGDRGDAVQLHRAQGGALPLDWINPWYFRRAVSPLVAAREEGRRVALEAVVDHIRATAAVGNPVIVEGAGGLLSPLLERADAPELIENLGARPVVVAANGIGVVGRVRLVWQGLPVRSRRWAQVVLMDPEKADVSTATNRDLLGEYLDPRRIHAFPRLRSGGKGVKFGTAAEVALAAVVAGLGIAG